MARSFISISAINRMISASNRRRKEEEREELINAQNGTRKEFPPTYSLVRVEFNMETRAAKIEIEQAQRYRTVERYVTQNYQKYPIFSPWKVKTKSIRKSLKLSNAALERLNYHEDPLIRMMAEEIVIALDREDLQPSWFVGNFLEKEHNENIERISREAALFRKTQQQTSEALTEDIAILQERITQHQTALKKINYRRSRIVRKIEKLESTRKSLALDILSLGIRKFLISNRRHVRLQRRLAKLDDALQVETATISKCNGAIAENERKIKICAQAIKEKEKDTREKLSEEHLAYNKKVEQIVPLSSTYVPDESFILLKKFIGLEYEKIVGCYIIHNREKDKYYVGQSKDVMKRIRQHFRGTAPNNIAFAEDYYSSEFPNKEDLFELKIIPCETKDELDETERLLIEQYDAFNSGYNGTNGNT